MLKLSRRVPPNFHQGGLLRGLSHFGGLLRRIVQTLSFIRRVTLKGTPKLLRRVPLNSLRRVNKSLNTLRRVTSEGSLNLPNCSSLASKGSPASVKMTLNRLNLIWGVI